MAPGEVQDAADVLAQLQGNGPYEALPDGRFVRLLQIAHDPHKRNGFSLEIKTFDLDEAPDYWALSYTWGPPRLVDAERSDEPTFVPVECDGESMHVPHNLLDFLHRARDDGLFISETSAVDIDSIDSKEPFENMPQTWNPSTQRQCLGRHAYLWADAICINQSDFPERSHQVGLMGDIYTRAERVLVWLGSQQPSDDTVWAFGEFIPLLSDLDEVHGNQMFYRQTIDLRGADVLAHHLGEETCSRWRQAALPYFEFIGTSSWFTRGWVVQEALLKQPDCLVILAGTQTLRWKSFEESIRFFFGDDHFNISQSGKWLNKTNPSWTERGKFPSFGVVARARTRIKVRNSKRDASSAEHSKIHISQWEAVFKVVWQLRRSHFSNPKDHIYGSYGLANKILGANATDYLPKPDYTLSDIDVFADFTATLLSKGVALDRILGFVENHSMLKAADQDIEASLWPSWVPHYTEYNMISALQASTASREVTFDAALVKPRHISAVVQGRVLHGRGHRMSAISEEKPRPDWSSSWVLSWCLREGIYPPTSQSYLDAMIRTMTMDRDPLTSNEISNANELRLWTKALRHAKRSRSTRDVVRRLTNRLKKASFWGTKWASLPDDGEEGEASTMSDEEIQKNLRLVERHWRDTMIRAQYMQGRNLFCTESGLLGHGPKWARTGDELWLLEGCRLPLILRKAGQTNQYRVVGTTYVHGIMYGEAVRDESEINFRDIEIV